MIVSRNSLKWLPALVVPVVVVGAIIAVPLQAGAAVDLPDKTPEQVLLLVNDSTVSTFSGTIAQSSDLGLPSLDLGAGMTGAAPTDGSTAAPGPESAAVLTTALELLSGSHEFRVYVSDPSTSRIQVMDHLAERDLVRNGSDVWLYDSSSNAATHLSVPAQLSATAAAKFAELESQLPTDLSTPAQLAERFLGDLDPSTTVSVGTDTRVAGRGVYQLVLTPKATDTLVASVSIAVDAETGLPLQVTVLAQGQAAPALQVGFTAIDFAQPAADLFNFVPPATATVTEQALPAMPDAASRDHAEATAPAAGDLPTVTGTGWSSIVEIPAAAVPAELSGNPMLEQLTQAVDGGRALTTSLLSVFLAQDGRVFAGAVPLPVLQAAAG
ncbi:sigma-E factor regulatory protein RseB domain-containing protein [Cryobacterium sp. PH29-G1]|uniref:LolA family protein n=1 Tax=Cryobacterium sp. PH29-G1 TaxID=3046211 RepID=UPI0024B94048|nr:sigma-E factor regulatory protein RseB domain-containing protein [Cryobacterium sp. PH29-G1]MDJ0348218.1 sigma-E factor regulatory protein RseB domain-containing protein [Cryobacterium sp. PH29-G1]